MFQAFQDVWAHLVGQLPPVDMSSNPSTSAADTPAGTSSSPQPPKDGPSSSERMVNTKTYRSERFTPAEVARLKKRGFVGAVDQGTTSTRFIIFCVEQADPVVSAQVEITNFHPKPGWHEQDPFELLESVEVCIEAAGRRFLSLGFEVSDLKTIGITNQRETTIVWNWDTGKPVYNAIVWTDLRTASTAESMKKMPLAHMVPQLTGLPFSNYPSITKLMWICQNVPEARELHDSGILTFGTVDSWLIHHLNGGPETDAPHVTDTTNASRTMMMNLSNLHYEPRILGSYNINPNYVHLPKIVASSDPHAFGCIRNGLFAGVRITGCLGDQSAALVGQCAFEPGQAKNTYGTGCFMLYNAGSKRPDLAESGSGIAGLAKSGLLATVAYDFHPGGDIRLATYALEGSVASAGSAVKFLIKNMEFADDAEKINDLAKSVPDNGGVVFVTAFSGLLAPYWAHDARGTMFGLTHHTQKGHIARATLEATCYQSRAILNSMEEQSGSRLTSLAVDGGLSNSDLCMQTQANILGIPIVRPAMRETTALGAAFAAGLAIGCWSGTDELVRIKAAKEGNHTFMPDLARKDETAHDFAKWSQAVAMCRGWVRSDDPKDEDESDDEGNPV